MYSSRPCDKVASSSKHESSNHENDELNETNSEQLCLSDNDSDHDSFKTPTNACREDPTYEPSPTCASDYSPDIAETPRQNEKQQVDETKSSGLPIKSDTNRAVQTPKMASGLNRKYVEALYYLCSEKLKALIR